MTLPIVVLNPENGYARKRQSASPDQVNGVPIFVLQDVKLSAPQILSAEYVHGCTEARSALDRIVDCHDIHRLRRDEIPRIVSKAWRARTFAVDELGTRPSRKFGDMPIPMARPA